MLWTHIRALIASSSWTPVRHLPPDVKSRTGELVKLAFSARHMGLSTCVLTQQTTNMSKPYRDKTSGVILFYNPSKYDMQRIECDFLNGVGKEELKRINTCRAKRKQVRTLGNTIEAPSLWIPPS